MDKLPADMTVPALVIYHFFKFTPTFSVDFVLFQNIKNILADNRKSFNFPT